MGWCGWDWLAAARAEASPGLGGSAAGGTGVAWRWSGLCLQKLTALLAEAGIGTVFKATFWAFHRGPPERGFQSSGSLWRAYLKVVELEDGCVASVGEFYGYAHFPFAQPSFVSFAHVLVIDVEGEV